ncbi:hypothetical protein OAF37_00070 [Rubripirellula sp.]|nr:hypothetical protein [Rubripirellula sp.]
MSASHLFNMIASKTITPFTDQSVVHQTAPGAAMVRDRVSPFLLQRVLAV